MESFGFITTTSSALLVVRLRLESENMLLVTD